MERKEYDYVNPEHYKGFSKEVIDMMVDIWGKRAVSTYCEINSFKYRMRVGNKPDQPVTRDLKKAKWYIDKSRELREVKPALKEAVEKAEGLNSSHSLSEVFTESVKESKMRMDTLLQKEKIFDLISEKLRKYQNMNPSDVSEDDVIFYTRLHNFLAQFAVEEFKKEEE